VDWNFEKDPSQKAGYLRMFEILIPKALNEYDPNTFYWPSSPSSGGCFEMPNDFNRGDQHYWSIWGGLHFTEFREHFFRFASEYGFQSMPPYKTIESFTLPEDRNIFSYVMEKHQKNGTANEKIMAYIGRDYKYPKDLPALVYTSQVLQAEAIRYAVEHMRRNRGRCMGSIYWQLNDCWPVASWSSIDYYGRWKALHYSARRFYAPVMLSACDEGSTIRLNISNETMSDVKGTVVWKLIHNQHGVLKQQSFPVEVSKLSTFDFDTIDFASELQNIDTKRNVYFEYSLLIGGELVSTGTVLFVPAKYFEFADPKLSLHVTETQNAFEITITAKHFARFIELSLKGIDMVFSDNWFDLSAGDSKQILVEKSAISNVSIESFTALLSMFSVFDIDK
jgi:beta-mannosidase